MKLTKIAGSWIGDNNKGEQCSFSKMNPSMSSYSASEPWRGTNWDNYYSMTFATLRAAKAALSE